MIFRYAYKAVLAFLLILSVSCAPQEKTRTWVDLDVLSSQVQKAGPQSTLLEPGEVAEGEAKPPRSKDMGQPGPKALSPSVIDEAELAAAKPEEGEPGGILLNFDNADIYEFIQVICETLDINYIVDPKVKGVVNIRSGRRVGKAQLFDVFKKILHINNLDIRNEGEYFYIHPAKGVTPRKVFGPGQQKELRETSQMVVQILPIIHLSSAEAIKLIEPYLSEAGSIYNLTSQNTLIVHDFESKVLDVATLLSRLDISPLASLKIRLIRVENAPLYDMRDELIEILAALFVNPKDHESVSVIPLERVNSLLLVSKSEQLINNADRWIRELDVVPSEGRDSIYFYNVRNSVASELATLVNALIEGDSTVKPASGATSSTSADSTKAAPTTPLAPPQSTVKSKAKSAAAKGSTLRFVGDPLLLADDSRNIILIRALQPDYSRLVKLLARLDNLPRQVLIEVLVAEVKLTEGWEFGIEWALKNNQLKFNDSKYGQTFSTSFTNVAASAAGGFSYAIFNSASEVVGLLNALADQTDVSLMSSPQILVLNNEKATVNVGDQVPIVTTETQREGESATVDKTVQYKDTGTILNVTPRINYNGIIILDIDQQVSQANETTSSSINSPTISTRELKTKLAVKDGQSILMGGLISKTSTNNQNKVPLLGDIPGLGWLFKYEKEVDVKTELLVMITPYVIETEDVLDQYIKQFQAQMNGIRQELKATK